MDCVPVRQSMRIALACTALLAFGAFGESRASTIEIVHPRNLSTALGPTEVEVRLVGVEPARAERLVIKVDGAAIASITEPPWTATFDAGDGSQGHVIEAILALSDGTALKAIARTTPLRINERLRVNLVNLYPLVLDRGGSYVTGLEREDFRIREDGVPQTIERFTTEHRPLRVAIVLDTSLSMTKGGRLDQAKKAAFGFLDILTADDDALVVAFADQVDLLQDVTRDRTLLANAIGSTRANGGTALYDAIWRTSRKLEEFDGRRVMVLLSDGRDEAANGFEPGSLHTLEEAKTQAVRSEVMIFAIGLGKDLDREYAREWTRSSAVRGSGSRISLREILEALAVDSGGRLLLTQSATKLRRAFSLIAADLRHQYSMAYEPTNAEADGLFRTIEVSVPERNVDVVVRRGYYAREEREGEDAATR